MRPLFALGLLLLLLLLPYFDKNACAYSADGGGGGVSSGSSDGSSSLTFIDDHIAFKLPVSCNGHSEPLISQLCRTLGARIFNFNASSDLPKPKEYYSPNNMLQRSVNKINVTCDTRNYANLNRTLFKIRDPAAVVNIYVIGGSMTAGRLVGGYDGAWPRLLNSHLNNKVRKA